MTVGKRRKKHKGNVQVHSNVSYKSNWWTSGPGTLGYCTSSAKLAFVLGNGVQIYGSNYSQVNKVPWEWDYKVRIVDDRYPTVDTVAQLNVRGRQMFPQTLVDLSIPDDPPIMTLIWDDFSYPNLRKEWWEELNAWLLGLPDKTRVVFYCQGGMGRTGTALSILAGLNRDKLDFLEGEDPVHYVGRVYCEGAVESQGQAHYIEYVTGLKVDDQSWGKSYILRATARGKQATTAANSGAPYPDSVAQGSATTAVIHPQDDDDGSYNGPNHRVRFTRINPDGTVEEGYE